MSKNESVFPLRSKLRLQKCSTHNENVLTLEAGDVLIGALDASGNLLLVLVARTGVSVQ
jgi:hypothetical protein